MIQKEVDFSSITQGLVNGQDQIDDITVPLNIPARLVIYLDSFSCTSCVISRLNELENFFNISKSSNGAFLPVFVFTPSEKEKNDNLINIKNSLKQNNIDFPVYIDFENSFLSNNRFIPEEQQYHMFLLDNENKIVLIGNPVSSDSLWDLYMNTIEALIEKHS